MEENMTNGVTTQDETTFISLLTSMKQHENLLKYNLNLIDELHADENAHTRIFIKLLSHVVCSIETGFHHLFEVSF